MSISVLRRYAVGMFLRSYRKRFYLSRFYNFSIKDSFYLVDAHFFPFLSRKKKKGSFAFFECGERKKKKDRGQAPACREIWEYSAQAGYSDDTRR